MNNINHIIRTKSDSLLNRLMIYIDHRDDNWSSIFYDKLWFINRNVRVVLREVK